MSVRSMATRVMRGFRFLKSPQQTNRSVELLKENHHLRDELKRLNRIYENHVAALNRQAKAQLEFIRMQGLENEFLAHYSAKKGE